jgi:protein-L-isoaspartate O-methyltransferase
MRSGICATRAGGSCRRRPHRTWSRQWCGWLTCGRVHACFEVGTGSGYSTALLACLVGFDGRVVSIDVDSGLVERAARLQRADAFRQVLVQHGDGRLGWESAALYDRVVAWATAEELPAAWAEQLMLCGGRCCARAVAPVGSRSGRCAVARAPEIGARG